MDKMGTSDPSVTIFTDPKRKVETKTVKNTLSPVWDNEVFYLMVQVPPQPCNASAGHAWKTGMPGICRLCDRYVQFLCMKCVTTGLAERLDCASHSIG